MNFELHVAESHVSSGTVSVGWCVPREVLEALDKKGLKNPQVVLIVAPKENYHIRKEYRKVVPLKDLLAYVEFRSAGENRIWGFISDDGAKATKAHLEKRNSEYTNTLLNCEGDGWTGVVRGYPSWDDEGNRVYPDTDGRLAEPIGVYVPRECFAPEPSDAEKAWVNWLRKGKCVDQCEFRRRRLFAYTLQVPVLLAAVLANTILTLAAFLVGSRRFSLQPLLHPLTYTPLDALYNVGGESVFIRSDKDTWVKRYALLPLMPAILIAFGTLMFFLVKFNALFGLLHALLVLGGVALAAVAVLGLLGLGIYVRDERRKILEAEDAWYLDEEEAALMACSPGKRLTTLGDLPARKRTLRLRFLDLKSKVCRPFSA